MSCLCRAIKSPNLQVRTRAHARVCTHDCMLAHAHVSPPLRAHTHALHAFFYQAVAYPNHPSVAHPAALCRSSCTPLPRLPAPPLPFFPALLETHAIPYVCAAPRYTCLVCPCSCPVACLLRGTLPACAREMQGRQ